MAADIQKGSGMSGLIYCSYKRAAKPYYLEIAGRNIYSIEELCYFLQDNIYLLDENIMTSEFCDWLEKELDAGELSKGLRRLMEDQKGFRAFCMQIITDSGYFSKNEMQFLGMKLQKMDHQSNYENRKIKADQLMEHKKYLAAIAEYRSLLLHASDSPSDVRVSGDIWHNMGTAYAKMFCFERAVSWYEKAYELSHRADSLKAASQAVCFLEDSERVQWFLQRYHISPQQYASMKKNLNELIQMSESSAEFEETARLERLMRVSPVQAASEAGRQVNEWKEEYIAYKG